MVYRNSFNKLRIHYIIFDNIVYIYVYNINFIDKKIKEKERIVFQTAELGKVDLGGGGTIAYILALYGMNVIDSGVAVLNMHAPWEATSKADVYETYLAFKAFIK